MAADAASLPKEEAYVRGMSLKNMTQKSAYKALRRLHQAGPRKDTTKNLRVTRNAIMQEFDVKPSTTQVWKSTRDRDTSKRTQQFRWRTIHNAHACGPFFARMSSNMARGDCVLCGKIETIDHVLFECVAPEREALWEAAERLWSITGDRWPNMNLGLVMGCGLFRPRGRGNREEKKGRNRLLKKIVSETAFLIWKLRCERRIEHAHIPDFSFSKATAVKRLIDALDQESRTESFRTNERRFKRRALNIGEVLYTWRVFYDNAVIPGERALEELTVGVLGSMGCRSRLEYILSDAFTAESSHNVRN
ncbi:hypothetical protein CYLTODRAFT_342328 [Cylindrobasidium torrendii FP15055 ss-10]|uniref:Reverse transcriptase zinc-binding domain-containing protein n=1 Tax=Cylindrobasidium torrendii FP15055 ss-10 TaxID=1314674 RepID=A0A0D7BSK1_9AGAR|nr:hypothetical protein CYLTODRAFT_342328 [Cylindrobasidium torrendii FP15055 ss-10]